MGFLCKIKKDKKNVNLEDLQQEQFLRDIGLDAVNNLNPEINFCQEIFYGPEYYVTGLTKLVSGYTSTITGCTSGATIINGIYNLDYNGDINFDFILTGSTDYTGYTGSLCFKVFSGDKFNPVLASGVFKDSSENLSKCLDFSGITSTTITNTITEGTLSKNWQQYLVRPYFNFFSKDCNPGVEFDNWSNTIQYNTFQNSSDYYFMTVTNPPTPLLAFPETSGFATFTLYTDRLYYNGATTTRGSQAINNELNYFILGTIPANNVIILTLNGVVLTQGYDYNFINQGSGRPPIVQLKEEIKLTDWLIANYVIGNPGPLFTYILDAYFIDTIKLDGFTSGATPNYRTLGDNTLNYNTTTGKYEFFTTLPIDPNYSVMLMVNGVSLAENFQYFKSTSFDGRIIFDGANTQFSIGDLITVFAYSKSGVADYNYGSLGKNEFTARWSVPPTFTNPEVTGKFIVEVFNKQTNLLLYKVEQQFIPTQANYEATFNSLSLNIYYKFKVTFEATYTGYLNNKVITCSYAEGYFDTTNNYINNTY